MAFDVLRSVETRGGFADRVLDGRLQRAGCLDERDRALATEIVYGVLRRRGTLDRVIEGHVRKPLERLDAEVMEVLRIGAYQILFLDRVPDHAAVHVSVELAHRAAKPGTAGLVNAVLRSLCRKKSRTGKEALVRGAARGEPDFPGWLKDLWKRDLGAPRARELLHALLAQPDVTLRVNPLKTARQDLVEALAREGVLAEPMEGLPWALRVVKGSGDIRKTRCCSEGLCVQQEAASQLVVDLLRPCPGERVLDVCAAPGLKTSQIGARMGNRGVLVALDRKPARVRELRRLCRRMGVRLTGALAADGSRPGAAGLKERSFDRVLVDAPCSGLGILRRTPEKKWRPPPDFQALADLQAGLLCSAAGLVREGGVLVYSTCTVNRQENEDILEAFLARHPEFRLEDASLVLPRPLWDLISEAGTICTWRRPGEFDFFYAARLRRTGRKE